MKTLSKLAVVATLAALTFNVYAAETAIGKSKEVSGMEFAAVYLQPITMDKVMGLPAAKADIHLEVDIHATKEYAKNTFQEGWWIPYLTVNYTLAKLDKNGKATHEQKGELMPMVADDGPHYGSNIKLNGPGKYRVKFHILPPSDNKKIMFGRHIDKETAAPEWWKPIDLEWDFDWAGTGKKGGY